jgi:phage gp36-like protein
MPGGYGPSGQAQQYATIAQLIQNGMSQQALSSPSISSAAVQDAALFAASQEIDNALRDQYQLPLTQWGNDIVKYTCWIAAYSLICIRGFNPNNEADAVYEKNDDKARKWLSLVAQGRFSPDITDSSPNAAPGVQAPAAQPQAASPSNNRTRGTWRR